MFQKAKRTGTHIKLAITGPSGSGKTYSALRLATGLSDSGKIAFIGGIIGLFIGILGVYVNDDVPYSLMVIPCFGGTAAGVITGTRNKPITRSIVAGALGFIIFSLTADLGRFIFAAGALVGAPLGFIIGAIIGNVE